MSGLLLMFLGRASTGGVEVLYYRPRKPASLCLSTTNSCGFNHRLLNHSWLKTRFRRIGLSVRQAKGGYFVIKSRDVRQGLPENSAVWLPTLLTELQGWHP